MCNIACLSSVEFQKALISNFILPIAVGVLAFLGSNMVASWRTRRRYSLLGAAVLASLIEEVSNGIGVLESITAMMSGQTRLIADMPRKSWGGMTTISDDVLERILCTSRGKHTEGFPAQEIRIHLKNYFDHMCTNIDSVTSAIRNGQQWQPNAQLYLVQGKYVEAAKGVLAMLETVKKRLEQNATSWFPE